VISGRREAVIAVIAELGLDDDEFRMLDVSVAPHSPLVEPILAQLGHAHNSAQDRSQLRHFRELPH